MHFPEQLFNLPFLKDLQTQQIEVVIRRVPCTLTATNISAVYAFTVPKDRFFILTSFNCAFSADPTGGSLSGAAAYCIPSGATEQHDLMACIPAGFALAAGQPLVNYGQTGSVWVPPGSAMYARVSSNFSANHEAVFTFTGISIPRGNVAVA